MEEKSPLPDVLGFFLTGLFFNDSTMGELSAAVEAQNAFIMLSQHALPLISASEHG